MSAVNGLLTFCVAHPDGVLLATLGIITVVLAAYVVREVLS